MIKYLCFAISLVFSSYVRADALRDDIDCAAIFSEDHIFARFPVLNQKKIWKWNIVERTLERPEYAWIAETGNYRGGKFEGDGFAFSLLIGSANLEKTPPQQGGLKDLLRSAKKNAFFTKKSKYYMDERKKDNFNHLSVITAKITDDSAIMAMVVDKATVNEGKSNNPTHMKLTAIYPDVGDSYTCIPEIESIKIK